MSNHFSAITEVKASEKGALDGYEVKCQDCGNVYRTSLLTLAREYAHDHAEYMVKKEAGKKAN